MFTFSTVPPFTATPPPEALHRSVEHIGGARGDNAKSGVLIGASDDRKNTHRAVGVASVRADDAETV